MDEDVQHWLTEVQKYKSEFSDAHEHVLKMSEATRAHDVDTSNAEAQVAADILKSIPWKQYDETEGNNLTYPPALNGSISQDGANPGSDISSIPPNLQYLPGFLPLPQYWYGYKPPPPSEWPSYTNPGPYSALPPLPGPPPQSLSGSAPPVAPQRANSAYQSL